jgi:hypothetical protein
MIDNTQSQFPVAVSSPSSLSSRPVIDHAQIHNQSDDMDYFFLSFACSSFVGKYSSTM